MKVYVVTEYNSFDKSMTVLNVQSSKKKAQIRIEELDKDSSHWSEFSFEEFEVG